MKITAFAATNHRKSINAKMVQAAIDLYEGNHDADVEVEVLDLNDYELPIFSIERLQADGIPDRAKDFFAKIGGSDGVIVSFAEHNGNFTAAYKNLFDWASRIDMKVFQGKPAIFLATSPGSMGGGNVLRIATGGAPFIGADLKGSLSVPKFPENYDFEAGSLLPGEYAEALAACVASLHSAVSVANHEDDTAR